MPRPPLAAALLAVLSLGLLCSARPAALSLHPRADIPASQASTTKLSDSQIKKIQGLLNKHANESWEIGTHAQALLELEYPASSVFSPSYYPPPSSPVASAVISIASSVVKNSDPTTLQLIRDGSSADPASVGVAVLLANWTASDSVRSGTYPASFEGSASKQLYALLQDTPRSSDGAISHRTQTLELWNDFIYMAPPFLAYYGVLSANTSLIQEAYDQIRLYRSYLQPNGTGLWSHILWGANPDYGQWLSGNAWVAAGTLRVYATITNSPYASQFTNQTADLASWSANIVQSAFAVQNSTSSLLPNYANTTRNADDAAGTALIAASAYRLAQYGIDRSTLTQAEAARQAVYAGLDKNGVLAPVCDPATQTQMLAKGEVSPEAEAFVLLMEAAYRDFVATNDGTVTTADPPKVGAAGRGVSGAGWASVLVAAAVGAGLLA